jgi:transcription-repair coupling factor (superfamily II helicase)
MTHAEGRTFIPLLDAWRESIASTALLSDLCGTLAGGGRVELAGLPGSLGTLLLATVISEATVPGLLAVLPDEEEAEEAAQDMEMLLGSGAVSLLPPWHFRPYEELSPNPTLVAERLTALKHIAEMDTRGGVVVTSARALALPSPSGAELIARDLLIEEGEERGFDDLVAGLVTIGYERTDMVGAPAEFSVRGGIVDIYAADRNMGVRVEFWGDAVESIREFQVADQRTTGGIGTIRIPPVREVPFGEKARRRALQRAEEIMPHALERNTPLAAALEQGRYIEGLEWYLPLFVDSPCWIADLLPTSAATATWEPDRIVGILETIQGTAHHDWENLEDPDGWLPPDHILPPASSLEQIRAGRSGIDLPVVATDRGQALKTGARPTPRVAGDIERLREELSNLQEEGLKTTILVEDEGQRYRLSDLLEQEDGGPEIALGQLAGGFAWPAAGLAVWPDHEIFQRPRRRRPVRLTGTAAIRSYRSLSRGDLVVHVDHGIGRYEGLRTLEVDGNHTELLELTYARGDRLLVPVDQMDRVQRYVGGDQDSPPQLNTLGSPSWERTKERTRTDLLEMAKDLARTYATREAISGTTHPLDDILMEELEASFPYTETPDQARAVEEVKQDLESDRIMDRLICGDVGYGKTEVAIRAALKVIEGGHQVAVLVPTTLLAQQHLETFRVRLGSFPVRIEMLSRFRTPAQQRRILEGLARGQVDLVIGTHRLLSDDVSFASLGLLVVDEEHRFGVKAKERLRSLRTRLDVLSLTATPIPRTLHMALLDIRDMSIITTPPQDRLPVHTEVLTFDEKLIEEAIRQEMGRGGQVFLVHNRVQSIEAAGRLVARLVPEARQGVAHGQMRERDLEAVMLQFTSGGLDVLVTTMIIESGLDLPNANTLIVNRADRFGLAQLYQLRGRVGRSSQKAYAYFLVPPGRRLTRDARRRLQAVQEHSELGAGFHLAMRDLEIRGAGNLLGAQQHGRIAEVGFDLYVQMLEEAVGELRGSPEQLFSPPRMELPGEAYIPDEYVAVAGLRVDFYRKAVEARTLEDINDLHQELRDRFGPLPETAGALIEASAIRVLGAELGLESIVVRADKLCGTFRADRELGRSEWESLMERLGSGVRFGGEAPLRFEFDLSGQSPLDQVREARNRLLMRDGAKYFGSFTAS